MRSRSPASKTSTRPRPRSLARYMAASASDSSPSALRGASGSVTTTPTLAEPKRASPPTVNGSSNASTRRRAIRSACSSSATSSHTTANSSPPKRATVSLARSSLRRRGPIARSSSSPAPWPSESLMTLRLSRSRNSTATRVLSRDARSSAWRSRSSSSVRLGRPVSASCSASWRMRASVCRLSIAAASMCATDCRKSMSVSTKARRLRALALSTPSGVSGLPMTTFTLDTTPWSIRWRACHSVSVRRSAITTGPLEYSLRPSRRSEDILNSVPTKPSGQPTPALTRARPSPRCSVVCTISMFSAAATSRVVSSRTASSGARSITRLPMRATADCCSRRW